MWCHTFIVFFPTSSIFSQSTFIGCCILSTCQPSTTPSLRLSSESLAGLANEVRLRSCSRSNVCANMVHHLYSIEERKTSNVRGKLGKHALDPVRLAIVHRSAFEVYPLATGEQEDMMWHQRIKSIDEVCRRLNRYKSVVQQEIGVYYIVKLNPLYFESTLSARWKCVVKINILLLTQWAHNELAVSCILLQLLLCSTSQCWRTEYRNLSVFMWKRKWRYFAQTWFTPNPVLASVCQK